MRVVNTYFEKAERHNTTYNSNHKLITFCAEAATMVTLKTTKLSWVKV